MMWKTFWRRLVIDSAWFRLEPNWNKWKWRKRLLYLCRCKCWNEKLVVWEVLRSWKSTSCWCAHKDIITKHWMYETSLYNIRIWIEQRCNNAKNKWYCRYWWRWIKCERETFEQFRDDMYPTYQDWLSLDRINNDWNYCKENCRWATRKQQQNNMRTNRIIKYEWENYTLSMLSDKIWISKSIIKYNLNQWKTIEWILANKKH